MFYRYHFYVQHVHFISEEAFGSELKLHIWYEPMRKSLLFLGQEDYRFDRVYWILRERGN